MTNNSSYRQCRICAANGVADRLQPREMMFGLRDRFTYVKCADCGCLQLEDVPASLEKYYPQGYYSYTAPEDSGGTLKAALKRKFLYPAMTNHRLGTGSILGRFFCSLANGPKIPEWLRVLSPPVSFIGGVLDVGCGAGLNLLILRNCGFKKLHGVDPYISESLTYAGGVRIEKNDIHAVGGTFSLIMMHHVFEHLSDPLTTLQKAQKLLAPNGQILIRIPLSDSFAADKYRENWVQLDAPRHIFLHTRKSMQILADQSGLKLSQVAYDSSDFQFWGSEQYRRDIPLFDSRSHMCNPTKSSFSPHAIAEFLEQSNRLNQAEKGDQAAFVFEKIV